MLLVRSDKTMPNSKTIRVVLIGGSGYAGFEAVRWLMRHPSAELVGVFGPAD